MERQRAGPLTARPLLMATTEEENTLESNLSCFILEASYQMLSHLGKAASAKKQTQKYKDNETRQGSPTPALAQEMGVSFLRT